MSEEQKKYLLIIVALIVGGILLWAGNIINLPKLELELRLSLIITGSVVLLVTFIVVVVQFCYPKVCQNSPVTPKGSAPPVLERIEWKTLRNVVIGAGALVIVTFAWAGTYIFFKPQTSSEIALPIIIVAGVTVLLLVLGLLTFVFSVLKLSNKKEALGLPSGSVRAVIALMLLVIFAIVAIFLYSDISASSKLQTLSVAPGQLAEFKKYIDYVTDVDEEKDSKKTGNKTVFYRSGSKAAEDLARQLIVLLGTLVTAVSSFYFGSSSVAAANKQPGNTGGPNAKAVTPSNLKPGGAGQPLTITGSNLGNVAGVKLTLGKEELVATGVAAGDTSVDCAVTTKADTNFGPWTVIVSDNANNDSKIPESVTIGTKPTEPAQEEAKPAPKEASVKGGTEASPEPGQEDSEAVGKPKPEKVAPPILKAGAAGQVFTIVGSALKDVDGVKLTLKEHDDITAVDKSVSAADTEINCKITTDAEAASGPWDVVLMIAGKPVATLPGAVTIGS